MNRYLFFCVLLNIFMLTTGVNAQSDNDSYSKIKVYLNGETTIKLAKAGLETDHGILVKGKYYINDFTKDEINIIKGLGFKVDILIEDVVSYYTDVNRPSEIESKITPRGMMCDIPIQIEYLFETPKNYKNGSMGGYFTYEEMYEIFDSMHLKYPHLISKMTSIDTIKTLEGRTIDYVKLSKNYETDSPSKPKVLYTALHHAREPNSLSQMIFYVWYLLENYETDPLVKKLVDETQMFFIPCINPDGYVFNQTSQPLGGGLWRKNRWKDDSGVVRGVDLNRNYGFFWGFDNSGSSNNPNSNVFRGRSGFSEPETQAVRYLCLQNDFKIAQNYHTFGNLLIHPWGYNDQPTSEDVLFKALGSVMREQNSFRMGTATETVGYIVNGSSDDWMYGEVGEKSPVYSFTPEAGPSFWPPEQDIDYLNKSCMWMNLSTAWLTLSYISADEGNKLYFMNENENKIEVIATNSGLQKGSAEVSIISKTNGVNIVNSLQTISLESVESRNIVFELNVDTGFEGGLVDLVLLINNSGFITEKQITKYWLVEPVEEVYSNDFSSFEGFPNTNWGLTQTDFYSPQFSLTDSPEGNYLDAHYSEFLFPVFDLEEGENAYLSFFAKWELERDYDFVQVLASSDNVDFVPLCGKYTYSGTVNQDPGNPVFSGSQATWVYEEMSLNEFVGQKNVFIKLIFNSDDNTNYDGFYIDDFKVLKTSKKTSSSQLTQNRLKISPSIASKQGQLEFLGAESLTACDIILYDLNGRIVGETPLHGTTISLKPFNLSNGVYVIKCAQGSDIIHVSKIIIQN